MRGPRMVGSTLHGDHTAGRCRKFRGTGLHQGYSSDRSDAPAEKSLDRALLSVSRLGKLDRPRSRPGEVIGRSASTAFSWRR